MLGATSKSDKAEHGYLSIYEQILGTVDIDKLLELGIFRGHSLRLWKDWQPQASIEGWDRKPQSVDGCDVKKVNLESRFSISRAIGKNRMDPWDIVIDDAGHTMGQQQLAFSMLFPHSKYFVIEDLHTSFDRKFYGKRDESTFGLLDALRAQKKWTTQYATRREKEFVEANAKVLYLNLGRFSGPTPISGIGIIANLALL